MSILPVRGRLTIFFPVLLLPSWLIITSHAGVKAEELSALKQFFVKDPATDFGKSWQRFQVAMKERELEGR